MTTINIGKVQIQLSGPHWRDWHIGVSWYTDGDNYLTCSGGPPPAGAGPPLTRIGRRRKTRRLIRGYIPRNHLTPER